MSKKSVTICDIARLIDMSEATVSLALNGSPLVKDETRERVNQAAKELGYVPNLYAKRLVSGKSGVIGLVVPDIKTYIIRRLLNACPTGWLRATTHSRSSSRPVRRTRRCARYAI